MHIATVVGGRWLETLWTEDAERTLGQVIACDSISVVFQSDLDFGQFQRTRTSPVAFQNTFDRPRQAPSRPLSKNQRRILNVPRPRVRCCSATSTRTPTSSGPSTASRATPTSPPRSAAPAKSTERPTRATWRRRASRAAPRRHLSSQEEEEEEEDPLSQLFSSLFESAGRRVARGAPERRRLDAPLSSLSRVCVWKTRFSVAEKREANRPRVLCRSVARARSASERRSFPNPEAMLLDPARPDRVLVRSERLVPARATIVGCQTVPGTDTQITDHRLLVVDLKRV